MPLIDFKSQFALDVWRGAKRQTIRSTLTRRIPPEVGQLAHCYTGLRTRGVQQLGVWPIVRVEVLRMMIGLGDVEAVLGSHVLSELQRDELARSDGFPNWPALLAWFAEHHPTGDFSGWVISWNWSPSPFPEPIVGGRTA